MPRFVCNEHFSPNLNLDSLLSDKKGLEKFVLKRPAKQDLFQQIDDYIQSKENKVTKATITVFRTMKEHLKAFEIYRKKDITFSCFDYNFYDAFVEFLAFYYIQKRTINSTIGLKLNTIGKII